MEDDRQRQINEAAEKFAGAIRDSYRIVADRTVSAQQLNAELTQSFFNEVIRNLNRQAEANRAAVGELMDQQRLGREASQALARESANVYMDFLNSLASYYQGNVEMARARAQGRARGPDA